MRSSRGSSEDLFANGLSESELTVVFIQLIGLDEPLADCENQDEANGKSGIRASSGRKMGVDRIYGSKRTNIEDTEFPRGVLCELRVSVF